MTQETTAQTPNAKQNTPASTWRRWLPSWGLVGLALALRVLLPGLAPLDEVGAGALLRAEGLLRGTMPFTGAPAPHGSLVQPPTGVYLDALALALWPNARAVLLLHALVAALATILVYDLVRRAYGHTPARIAGLAYALHPLAIASARDVGAATWIVPIAALALHGLALAVRERDPRGWLEAALAAGLALATHLAAWPIALAVLLGIAADWRRARCPEMVAGLAACLLVALPHLAYQAQHGFYDVVGAWGFGAAGPIQGPLAGFRALVQSGSTWGAPSGLVQPVALTLATLTALLSVVVLVATAVMALRRWAATPIVAPTPMGFLLIGWLLIAALGLTLTTRDLGDVGRAMMIPAAAACLGAVMAPTLSRPWHRVRRTLAATLLVGLGLTGLSGYAAQRPDVRAAQALREHLAETASASDALYLLTDPDAPSPYGPCGWRYVLGDSEATALQPLADARALPIPLGREAFYLAAWPSPQTDTLDALGAELLDLPTAPENPALLFYRLPAIKPAELLDLPKHRLDVPFAAGIHLLGYTWPVGAPANPSASLTTVWLVTDPVPEAQPELLLQLFRDDKVVAESHGLGLQATLWQPNTVVLAWHAIAPNALEPGAYQLALGFYDQHTLRTYPPQASESDAYLVTGLLVPTTR
jgi:4-amino-4-deoxy-L-arabinose transferase-like glycosyltransferase